MATTVPPAHPIERSPLVHSVFAKTEPFSPIAPTAYTPVSAAVPPTTTVSLAMALL